MANVRVQLQKRKEKHGGNKFFIYIPKDIGEHLKLEAGHRVSFSMENDGPDKNTRKRKPFVKKEETENVEELEE